MSALGVGLAVLAACFLAGQALTVRLATRAGSTGHVLLIVLAVNTALFLPAAGGWRRPPARWRPSRPPAW